MLPFSIIRIILAWLVLVSCSALVVNSFLFIVPTPSTFPATVSSSSLGLLPSTTTSTSTTPTAASNIDTLLLPSLSSFHHHHLGGGVATFRRRRRRSRGGEGIQSYCSTTTTQEKQGGGDSDDDVAVVMQRRSDASNDETHNVVHSKAATTITTTSLAGDYLIESSLQSSSQDDDDDDDTGAVKTKTTTTTTTWTLIPLSSPKDVVDVKYQQSQGGLAWAALHLPPAPDSASSNSNLTVLVATFREGHDGKTNSLHLSCSREATDDIDALLISVLTRILAQRAMQQIHDTTALTTTRTTTTTTIRWHDQSETRDVPPVARRAEGNEEDTAAAEHLYQSLFGTLVEKDSSLRNSEVVEMVDVQGNVWGRVPRPLVHKFNLLHRGIGILVTEKMPLQLLHQQHQQQQTVQEQPALYVHRRTATKRIFPNLYDMFVGGVSLAGEPSTTTACREVAEELGLTRAMQRRLLARDDEDNNNNKLTGDTEEEDGLSDCLLTCVVCTAYNRCVVDLFQYCMDTTTETIAWQEEEVAWGSFVPYDVVQAAASLSVQRLAQQGAWPSSNPPASCLATPAEYVHASTNQPPTLEIDASLQDWETWDFVPDGLLVWEAWLRYLERRTR